LLISDTERRARTCRPPGGRAHKEQQPMSTSVAPIPKLYEEHPDDEQLSGVMQIVVDEMAALPSALSAARKPSTPPAPRASSAPPRRLSSRPPVVRPRPTSMAGVIGESEQILDVYRMVDRVAPSMCTVLITGESGTGKELVARAVHNASARRDKPFVAINCGAIPENLLESEPFGHARGAFTRAHASKAAR